MSNTPIAFLLMLVFAVVLMAYSFMVPAFGAERQAARRLKKRMSQIADATQKSAVASMLRDRYLRNLSPMERWLESLPGMRKLAMTIEQAGHEFPAYRLVLLSMLLAVGAVIVAWLWMHNPYIAAGAGMAAAVAPFIRMKMDRAKRLNKFEEQLPEAVDVMTRALKAGHPFTQTLKLVAEEMDQPIAKEFGIASADINYGLNVKDAFINMLERVPNMTLMGLVTAVIVQKETGGNLAETLQGISKVIRGRFRFQRRVLTLTAEGRMSAWVLALIPFILFLALMLTNPDYLTVMIVEPLGKKIIGVAFVMMVIGILWLRRLIRLEV